MKPHTFIDIVTSSEHRARFSLQGAQLCQWSHPAFGEQLYLSEIAKFDQEQAIRGGVPLIFPQFGALGDGKKHGFAREVLWELCDADSFDLDSLNKTNQISFLLQETPATLRDWPYHFTARCDFHFSDNALTMRISIENTGETAFDFAAAFHTYCRVHDIQEAKISGLKGLDYWNNGEPSDKRSHENRNDLIIPRAIDRVYFDAKSPLCLDDGHYERHITMSGFNDVVIWNPWVEGAEALDDMNNDDYLKMICIEAAITHKKVKLNKDELWTGEQTITLS